MFLWNAFCVKRITTQVFQCSYQRSGERKSVPAVLELVQVVLWQAKFRPFVRRPVINVGRQPPCVTFVQSFLIASFIGVAIIRNFGLQRLVGPCSKHGRTFSWTIPHCIRQHFRNNTLFKINFEVINGPKIVVEILATYDSKVVATPTTFCIWILHYEATLVFILEVQWYIIWWIEQTVSLTGTFSSIEPFFSLQASDVQMVCKSLPPRECSVRRASRSMLT